LAVAVEGLGHALVAALALEFVVAALRARWIVDAVLLVRVVTAVVLAVATPGLQGALLVAALELVRLATTDAT